MVKQYNLNQLQLFGILELYRICKETSSFVALKEMNKKFTETKPPTLQPDRGHKSVPKGVITDFATLIVEELQRTIVGAHITDNIP
ncbi:hypothetical protein TNCV_1868931 [Trichonephila clavipes]|nr:hypothetical protein TNCV_1868931 [Trichonephila clavipes]